MRVNTYWIVLLFSFYSLNAFSKSLTDSIPPSPFGEKIEYSEDQREICGQLKSRIESQGAMQHPAIKTGILLKIYVWVALGWEDGKIFAVRLN